MPFLSFQYLDNLTSLLYISFTHKTLTSLASKTTEKFEHKEVCSYAQDEEKYLSPVGAKLSSNKLTYCFFKKNHMEVQCLTFRLDKEQNVLCPRLSGNLVNLAKQWKR